MNTDRTVFVVDDDLDFRDSLAAWARRKGFAVKAFSSAEEFLAHLEAAWKGCVLVDVRSERVSGMALLQKLKTKKAAMPAIATATGADVPLAVKAMQEGAFAFVEKPAKSEELGEVIHRALEIDQQHYALRQEIAELEARLATF